MRLILSVCLLIYAAYGWAEQGRHLDTQQRDIHRSVVESGAFSDKRATTKSIADKTMKVSVVSSEWPLYVYLSQGGDPGGYAYDITQQVMQHSGLHYDYQILPWSRVYRMAQSVPNVLISGIARTPLREHLFNWIAPLTKPNQVYFYRLKSRSIAIERLEDFKAYTVATERDTYHHQFLQQEGLMARALITSYRDKLMKLLLSQRVDFVLLDEAGFNNLVEKEALDHDLFVGVYLALSVSEYLAFSKGSSPELMDKVKESYQTLKLQGKFMLR